MENNDITISGSEATWVMPRLEGELGGTYMGRFVFRCFLDPLRQLQAGKDYRELLGNLGGQASEVEAQLAFCLTQLKHRVIKSPPFWSSTLQDSGIQGNLGDLNVISEVNNAAFRAEALFKEKIAKEREAVLDRSIKVAEELLKKQSDEEKE
jgi:hypothetical protein